MKEPNRKDAGVPEKEVITACFCRCATTLCEMKTCCKKYKRGKRCKKCPKK